MASLTSSLHPSHGSHPVSTTTLTFPVFSISSIFEHCSVHLYYALPPLLFVDPYELALRREAYTFEHWGPRDLEKPVHALEAGGAQLLLDVNVHDGKVKQGEGEYDQVVVEVPMHLRYGEPIPRQDSEGGSEYDLNYERVWLDWPKGFLRCARSASLSQLSGSSSLPPQFLPDHVSLFVNASAPESSSRIFLPIQAQPISQTIPPDSDNFASDVVYVPLGHKSDLAFVEAGTVLTVLLCFFWLTRVSLKTARHLQRSSLDLPKKD